jgi:hypothetical protein
MNPDMIFYEIIFNMFHYKTSILALLIISTISSGKKANIQLLY